MYFDEPAERLRPADRCRAQVACCVGHRCADDVLLLLPEPLVGGAEAAAASCFRDDRAAPSLPDGLSAGRISTTIGSTNDEAKRLARAGAPEGTLVWAREQTAGRGRRGRAWASPPGNLYCSLILRPDCAAGARRAARLCRGAGARRRARQRCRGRRGRCATNGRTTCWSTAARSPASCSNPRSARPARLDFVVVGIGVNLALRAAAMPNIPRPRSRTQGVRGRHAGGAARSVRRGISPSGRALARRGLRAGARGLAAAAPAASARPIRVRLEALTLDGRFLELDSDGALLLETGGEAGAGSPPAKSSRRSAEETRDAARHQRQQHQHRVRDLGRRPISGQWRTATEAQAHRRRIRRLARSAAGAGRAVARRCRRRGHRQRRARGQFQPAPPCAATIARPSRWSSASRASSSASRRWSTGRRRSAPTASSIPSAAHDRYKGPLIVVDFGTATTFDVVDARRQLLRRRDRARASICQLEALTWRRRSCRSIRIEPPEQVIGTDTVSCMQSGIYWGYVGLVEGLVGRIKAEFGAPMDVDRHRRARAAVRRRDRR